MNTVSRFSPTQATEVLQLAGDFDVANIADVAAAFDAAFDAGAEIVIVDLRKVLFVDSAMLNFLQQAHLRMHARRGRLALVRPEDHVWRVFEVTELERLFTSFTSLDAAINGTGGHSARDTTR